MKKKSRKARSAGFALVEFTIAVLVVVLIIGGIVTAISAQSVRATLLLRDTRLRYFLQGEMEVMTAGGAPSGEEGTRAYTPRQEIPKGLEKFRFILSREKDDKTGLVRLNLSVEDTDNPARVGPINVSGVLREGGK